MKLAMIMFLTKQEYNLANQNIDDTIIKEKNVAPIQGDNKNNKYKHINT